MKRINLAFIGRIALGGIFFYAGFVKLGHPLEFARSIAAYELLPYFFNILLAICLPWIECIAGLLLIVGWKVRPMAALTTLMMLVFMAGLVSAVVRGINTDCGCFEVGQSDNPPPLWIAIIRDLGFLMLSISVWIASHRQTAASRQ
jgi:hypothetical protein